MAFPDDIEVERLFREMGPMVEQIRPVLAGHPWPLQLAVIADLASILLAGHEEAIREDVKQLLVGLIDELLPVNVEMLREMRKAGGLDVAR